MPSPTARAPQIPEPPKLLPPGRCPRLEELREAFVPPAAAWQQQAVLLPGMTGHLSVWLAADFSCGEASDYPESPKGLCLAVSSAQALPSVFLPGAGARWRLTCDQLAK